MQHLNLLGIEFFQIFIDIIAPAAQISNANDAAIFNPGIERGKMVSVDPASIVLP